MATFLLILSTLATTVVTYSLGYITAEYKYWLKNLKQNNEETPDKPE